MQCVILSVHRVDSGVNEYSPIFSKTYVAM